MNEGLWDEARIEGFRVTSPDTDDVNWPRDTIRAYRAAQEPGDIEGKSNVSLGRVVLENAPTTARMRQDVAAQDRKRSNAEVFKPFREDPGALGLVARAARDAAPDGGPNPEPSKVLHPDRRPVFKKVSDPLASTMTRMARRVEARRELDEMEGTAMRRVTERLQRFMEGGKAAGGAVEPSPLMEQPEPGPPGLITPNTGFSPAMTGPYRGGKPSRFRLKWSTALVWTLLIVGSVMSAGLVYLIANWVY